MSAGAFLVADGAARVQIAAAVAAAQAAVSLVSDPDGVPASVALDLYKAFDQIERAGAAGKALLARRVADAGAHRLTGHRSPAELLAATSGSALGAAKGQLETSTGLASLPATRAALISGSLSAAQGQVITDAAVNNPRAEADLLRSAGTANLTELRDEALRAKAAADASPEATEARIHAARRVSRHTDAEGACVLSGRGTVTDGAKVLAEIDAVTDRIFRERGKAGTTECRDAYAWDALVEICDNSRRYRLGQPGAGSGGRVAPEHLALLRLDITALQRGTVADGELCEITGVGPIPVTTARRLLGDAALKVVITRGVDVLNITSLTRGPTQAMKYAALWTTPTCVVEGCSRTRLEYDHRTGTEYATTGHTRLDELDALCPGHHDQHTHRGWALTEGTGKRPMVPPDDPRHPHYEHPPP